jgi:hypothetical protein
MSAKRNVNSIEIKIWFALQQVPRIDGIFFQNFVIFQYTNPKTRNLFTLLLIRVNYFIFQTLNKNNSQKSCYRLNSIT